MKTHFKLLLGCIFLALMYFSCEKEKDSPTPPLTEQLDSIMHDSVYRSFFIHLPENYNASENYPLLIALHGFSSSAIDFQSQTHLNEKADEEGFIVVYPNGLRYPWDDRDPRAWNCGEPWAGATNYTDDTGFIEKLIDLVCMHFRVDENRIYCTGHSNGSRMAYRLGVELSCRLAAIAAHSGQLVYLDEPMEICPVSVLHLHSKDDNSADPDGYYTNSGTYINSVDSVLSLWSSRMGCNLKPVLIQEGNGLRITQWNCPESNTDILYYLTDTGDHLWFTEENSGISATDVIWDFLSAHKKE